MVEQNDNRVNNAKLYLTIVLTGLLVNIDEIKVEEYFDQYGTNLTIKCADEDVTRLYGKKISFTDKTGRPRTKFLNLDILRKLMKIWGWKHGIKVSISSVPDEQLKNYIV